MRNTYLKLSSKGLIYLLYKGPVQINNKRPNHSIGKWAKDIKRQFKYM